jgi:hypothetical protein
MQVGGDIPSVPEGGAAGTLLGFGLIGIFGMTFFCKKERSA